MLPLDLDVFCLGLKEIMNVEKGTRLRFLGSSFTTIVDGKNLEIQHVSLGYTMYACMHVGCEYVACTNVDEIVLQHKGGIVYRECP